MTNRDSNNQYSDTERNYSTWFTLITLLMIAGLLTWYAQIRMADFRANQQRLMEGSVTSTANELALLVEGLRNHVRLFAEDEYELLDTLATNPRDPDSYALLRTKVGTHFPNHFAFTIADADGNALLEGLDELVGKGCREDIGLFAQPDGGHGHEVYIHASPHGLPYHFDIMAPWGDADLPQGIFFVSFYLTDITRLLHNAQLPGQRLVLVRDDRPALIEASADGARDELPKAELGPAELAQIGAAKPVAGTRWVVDALLAPETIAANRARVYREAVIAFLLFALVALVMLLFVQRAEGRLLRSNRELKRSLQRLQQAQQQLVDTEKMAALGGLVAGVAHEINTPVGIGVTAASHLEGEIRGLARSLADGKLKKSQLEKFIANATEATNILSTNLRRAAELVRSFKLVATDQTHELRRKFDLKEYIDGVVLSLRPSFKHTPHRIDVHCPEQLLLDSYPGALSQVITNLVNNALVHAFGKDSPGHLDIRVRQLDPDRLELTFEDDGKGIPPEDLERVFEPFFTTNREGGGSGLGLHIVYNVVKHKLGGQVRCRSVPGEGTSFIIEIPNVAPGQPQRPDEKQQ